MITTTPSETTLLLNEIHKLERQQKVARECNDMDAYSSICIELSNVSKRIVLAQLQEVQERN